MRKESSSRTSWVVCGLLSVAVIVAGYCCLPKRKSQLEYSDVLMGMDIAGIRPVFRRQADMKMASTAPVIGVHVEGKPYAFVKAAMEPVEGHVVNMHSGTTAVSIIYCDMFKCVRVLKSENTSEPIELGVGGLAVGTLMLMYDGRRYAQGSSELPFEDVEFEQTTWSEWTNRFPESLVYDGQEAGENELASAY